jgi:signal-transduction protein with cAMP-binding, CBS, and nucleotidyltransferase domain
MPHSQTAVFRHVVRDHMADAPVVVSLGDSAAEAVGRMASSGASAAVVVDPDGTIRGILTEQDVVRRIACRRIGDQPVDGLMTRPVLTIRADDQLYQAIGFMRRKRLRHMPVVDAAGHLVGMLYLHDALAVATGHLVEEIDRLTHEDSMAGLAQVKAAQVQLARALLADEVPAPEIQALVSDINNDIYRRVLRLVVAGLEAEGWGEPPVPFAAIVMGSGGRRESYLFPDQDNGFVLADYPDEAHASIDPWFIECAERMTRELDALGFPLCKGGVMATNPLWRKTISQWKAQIQGWMRRKHEAMLLFCDIFFDFQPVWGEAGLAQELRTFVTELAPRQPMFLREMFGIQADHRAAVGFFNRFITERQDPAHRGEINLKLMGTLPLAEGVRLLALRHGVAATGTLARLEGLLAAGKTTSRETEDLRAAFTCVTGLQLRQQLLDYEAGRPVGNFVDPRSLSEREREVLRDGLKAINEFRTRLRSELTGELI